MTFLAIRIAVSTLGMMYAALVALYYLMSVGPAAAVSHGLGVFLLSWLAAPDNVQVAEFCAHMDKALADHKFNQTPR